MKMVRKNFFLADHTIAKLKVIQEKEGRTFSSLIREGIRYVIKKYYNETVGGYDPTRDSFN